MDNSVTGSPYASHDQVQKLLPWYVNGTLPEGEKHLVQQHLSVCLICAGDLATERELARQTVDEGLQHVAARAAFGRLMTRVASEPEIGPEVVAGPTAGAAVAGSTGRESKRVIPGNRRPFAFLRAFFTEIDATSMAAVSGMLIGTGALFAGLLLSGTVLPDGDLIPGNGLASVDNSEQVYQTASSVDGWFDNDDRLLRVIFSSELGARDIDKLLVEEKARTLHYSSQRHMRVVQLADQSHRDAALLRWRADPRFVFVEPGYIHFESQ